MTTQPPTAWTDELVLKALELRKSGKSFARIDQELGLNPRSSGRKIGMGSGQNLSIDEQLVHYRKKLVGWVPPIRRPKLQPSRKTGFADRIPEQVLRDRDERERALRTTTNILMGDPAPGFSALGRRETGS